MYTYDCLKKDIRQFEEEGLYIGSIGNTVLGVPIPFVFLGDFHARKTILVQGAIHAREHITAELIIEQIKYLKDADLCGGIVFVPMVNIDGVRLCQEGADFIRDAARRDFVLSVNGEKENDFTEWKANINAVDLNTNFPARWGTGAQNVRCASYGNFIGEYPCSEPESCALVNFSYLLRPAATLSYHIRGEEIYWEFFQKGAAAARDKKIAQKIAAETGYKIIGELASAGGYKDFCVQELGIPAYTIETGNMNLPFPFPYTELPKIFSENKNVPKILLDSV